MDKKLIKKLRDFFSSEEGFSLKGTPAADEEIENAEEELSLTFHDDYKEFIKLFGSAYVGLDIHSVKDNDKMGGESSVALTKMFRKKYPRIKDTYVVSGGGGENAVMIDKEGNVVVCCAESGKTEIVAKTLGEYIEKVFEPW